MRVSFTYRFNIYKSANETVIDEIKATNALFGDDLDFLVDSKIAIEEWLNSNVKNINDIEKYKRLFSNKTISFFGDSLTSDKLGYRSLIEKSQIFNKVIDFSISGSNSSDCFKIVSRKAQKGLSDIAVIFIGTNDAMEYSGFPLVDDKTYYRNLFNCINILKDNGIDVKLINVPFVKLKNCQVFTAKINNAIKELASILDLDVFDANSLLVDKACHEIDDTHLLPEYQLLLCNEFLKWLYEKGK